MMDVEEVVLMISKDHPHTNTSLYYFCEDFPRRNSFPSSLPYPFSQTRGP